MLIQYHFCFEAINQMFQDIWSNDRLFRGLPVIIEENFAQILFILCQNTRVIIMKAFN